MKVCRELFLDDIVTVWPLAVGTLTFAVPETVVRDTVSVTDLGNHSGVGFADIAALRAMLATKVRFSEDGGSMNVCVLAEAPSLKISTDRSVSGYAYTMTLGMKTLYYHEEEKAAIRDMEWKGCDYILEKEDGTLCLLRYFAPAQRFTHEVDGDGAGLTMVMKNVTGLQKIVEGDESDE